MDVDVTMVIILETIWMWKNCFLCKL